MAIDHRGHASAERRIVAAKDLTGGKRLEAIEPGQMEHLELADAGFHEIPFFIGARPYVSRS